MDNLPKGWEYRNLDGISKVISGYAFPSTDFSKEGIHKTVKITNVGVKAFIESKDEYGLPSKYNDKLSSFRVNTQDIVIALTRSIINDGLKVAIVPESYNNAFVNQRVAAIKSDNNLKSYIYYFLISNIAYKYVQEKSKSLNQPNLSINDLKSIQIPLPPLSEQTLIVAKLDALFARIDKSIALLEENIKHTKALMASVLEEVFGNGNSWKREPLNQVAKVERGKSKHRPRNDARLFGGIYPFVQTGDVRSADKYIKKYEVCYSEFGLKQSKLWKKGTICLTIAANIGDVAILGFDSCFPDSVVGITPKEMNNEFLFYYLKTLQLQLDKKANSAAQKNINLKILSEIDVPIPPIKIQNIIAKWFTSLEENQFKILSTQQSKLVYLKALKSSLLDRAFKGEL